MDFSDIAWRKSSFSETEACVEIAYPRWRKSTFSNETACVEVAHGAGVPVVGIRDSKAPSAGHLTVPHTALHRLVRGLR